MQAPDPKPYLWIIIAALGGGLLIAATMLTGKLMSIMAPKELGHN